MNQQYSLEHPTSIPQHRSLNKIINSIGLDYASHLKSFIPDIAYHYTNAETLTSIIREGKVYLRFSDSRCLNDLSESCDALKVYHEVCKQMLRDGKIDDVFINSIIDLKPDDITFYFDRNQYPLNATDIEYVGFSGSHPYNLYVCCLSRGNDLLPMWNYYLKSDHYDGYSIGLKTSMLRCAQHSDFGKGCSTVILGVIYDDEWKRQLIREAIVELFLCSKYEYDEMSTILSAIKHYLRIWSTVFKSNNFRHEEEIRIGYFLPQKDELINKSFSINYRSKSGLLVPYFDKCFNVDVFHSITVGPFSNLENEKSIQRDILTHFLTRAGCESINEDTIKFSEIPVRY